MITGAHAIIYSKNSKADRAFLKDVLKLPSVDAGQGWLIFGLPTSEVAIHPFEKNDEHELYFMCDDILVFTKAMAKRKVKCSAPQDHGWGILSQLSLPGGGKIGVYQPRHPRPKQMVIKKRVKSKAGKSGKQEIKKKDS